MTKVEIGELVEVVLGVLIITCVVIAIIRLNQRHDEDDERFSNRDVIRHLFTHQNQIPCFLDGHSEAFSETNLEVDTIQKLIDLEAAAKKNLNKETKLKTKNMDLTAHHTLLLTIEEKGEEKIVKPTLLNLKVLPDNLLNTGLTAILIQQ